jgi:hypothetical protein
MRAGLKQAARKGKLGWRQRRKRATRGAPFSALPPPTSPRTAAESPKPAQKILEIYHRLLGATRTQINQLKI